MSKVAVVTGGNKGIGFAICKTLLKNNIQVVLAARDIELGSKAVSELQAQGFTDVEFLHLDLNDPATITSASSFLKEKFGTIDILINNAGVIGVGSSTEQIATSAVETNYFGTLHVCEALGPLIKPGGRNVIVSSRAGVLDTLSHELAEKLRSPALTLEQLTELMNSYVNSVKNKNSVEQGWAINNSRWNLKEEWFPYSISKIGTTGLAKILAKDPKYQEKKILVNAVCPGYCSTDLNGNTGFLTAQDGAESIVWVALLPSDSTFNGEFFQDKTVTAIWERIN